MGNLILGGLLNSYTSFRRFLRKREFVRTLSAMLLRSTALFGSREEFPRKKPHGFAKYPLTVLKAV